MLILLKLGWVEGAHKKRKRCIRPIGPIVDSECDVDEPNVSIGIAERGGGQVSLDTHSLLRGSEGT